jgi:hypothetical protein
MHAHSPKEFKHLMLLRKRVVAEARETSDTESWLSKPTSRAPT